MLPPVLEVYVVWHPADTEGDRIAGWLLDHFHGTPYAGLVGGAVELYIRSSPWAANSDSPRPMPFQEPLPYGLPAPRVAAVVPVLGVRLARAVNCQSSGWGGYLTGVLDAARENEWVGVFPVRVPGCVDGMLDSLFGSIQAMDSASADDPRVLCRELAQQVAQLVDDPLGSRLTVFISHTKRHSPDEEPDDVDDLIARVRGRIAQTHLLSYFDEADLQPGSDWDSELCRNAASSGLLAVRTDLYAGREWCQREFLTAKLAGMPVVTLNAVSGAKERGSFLMDHVPIVGYRDHSDETRNESIDKALNVLVDEALRRALWKLQEERLHSVGFDWTPLHAPEPITVLPWLLDNHESAVADGRLLVVHPDPPLGPDEQTVIDQLFAVAGVDGSIDIVTPRTFASRGGTGL